MIAIPKIAHCFWYAPGGLPYLRYLSIASFALKNKDYLLKLYTLKDPLKVGRTFTTHEQSTVHITKDYFPELLSLENVELLELEKSYFQDLNFEIDTAVHWSDILRIQLLSTVGGYWIDSDIIFTYGISDSYLGNKEFSNVDTIISHTSLGSVCAFLSHRIGFLGASKSNSYYKRLWNELISYQETPSDYQALGAGLNNRIYPSRKIIADLNPNAVLHFLPNSALYALHLTELLSNRVQFEIYAKTKFILGCHWYGGGDQLHSLVNKLNMASDVEGALSDIYKTNPSILIELFIFAKGLISRV
jgi:hypothetical protein